ncbi:hypothetical protein AZE42_12818 [Rhizopogon vesiculosus]|uniref:Uncharacterized protein n=1 Tax=Rhizopogon vesiculosus TaxID=180088 RepID=A0A1J8QIV6_9AGAM|nr:hypothetical protein AZE42_12818 [Rhizopogon vesiculosus]
MPLAATLLDIANAVEITELLMTPRVSQEVDRPLSLVRRDAITEQWLSDIICELKSVQPPG